MTEGTDRFDALRWWQEHSTLDVLVETLVETLEGSDAAAADQAAQELAHELGAHVRQEEDVYFPLIEELAPDHAGEIRRAREAHRELLEQLRSLRTRLASGDVGGAREGLVRLLERFRAHEQAEERLIANLEALRSLGDRD